MRVRQAVGAAMVACVVAGFTVPGVAAAAPSLALTGSAIALGVRSDVGQLGTTMASSGDFVVVGSPSLRGNSRLGELLVFKRPASGDWQNTQPVAALTLGRGLPSGNLGISVAMSASTIVASDPLRSVAGRQDQGAVYVFTKPKGGWHDETQTATLTVPSTAKFELLGLPVAISGDTLVATMRNSAGVRQLCTFTRGAHGWADAHTAALSVGAGESQQFGASTAISGSTIVANSPSTFSTAPADVYVFRRPTGGWRTTSHPAATLHGDSAATAEMSGEVAISGTTIAAVAQVQTHPASGDHNLIDVFSRPSQGWSNSGPTATLNDGVLNESDELGQSLAISDDGILAGDPSFKTANGQRPGAAFLFARPKNGWHSTSATSILLPAQQPDNAFFGSSVAIVNGEAIVGAPDIGYGADAKSSGRIYIAPLQF
jgi:hypothetical protein